MAKNGVKFYRLGLNTVNGVERSTYVKYLLPGAMIFAKVNESAGTWDAEKSLYTAPAYYIWANGLEYKVADADALKYALEHIGSSEQKIKDIDASIDRLDASVNTLEEAVAAIEASYVKSIKAESDNTDYIVVEPVETSKGDVTVSISAKTVLMADASTNKTGLADAWDVKNYVNQIASQIHQFKYIVLEEGQELPTPSKETMYCIYLKPCHEEGSAKPIDYYEEYITIEKDGTYSWELIGDTKIDLKDYAKIKDVDASLANLKEYVDTQDASLKDYVDAADASLVEAIEDAIDLFEDLINEEKAEREAKDAEIDASIAEIKAVDASQEEHLAQLDASVNALEEKVLTGVVNSISSDTLSDYVSITENKNAVGDVSLYVDANVQNSYDKDSSIVNGLATTNYVEERMEWIEIEEDVDVETIKQTDNSYVNNSSNNVTVPNLTSLSTTNVSVYDLTSKTQIEIGE